MYKKSPKKNIEFYIDNGTFEWPELINSCHEMRDLLISKGYNLLYKEFNEGHSWGNWRTHVKYGLEYFWGLK